ncbi:MAG: hypothetical protein DRN53_03200 [Thermoprotei archaeon]|nr:MAG: hypothetical protein DRN53_03200 [Thermoprotei archaeon]
MPKIKIEDILPTGEKISIVLEGSEVAESRVLQILEMLRIMAGNEQRIEDTSKLAETLWNVLLDRFGDGKPFTSRDLLKAVFEDLGINLKLNTISTYLLRFYRRGLLRRLGKEGMSIRYVVSKRIPQTV